MDNSSLTGNGRQKISGIRLVYGNIPSPTQDPLKTMDYCTRLVMQLKEDEILNGLSYLNNPELYEMDELEFVLFEDEDEEEG